VFRNLVVDVRVERGGRCLRPRFRIPPKGVRILSRMVHPALHNENLSPFMNGAQIGLAAYQAKIRRDGYRAAAQGPNDPSGDGTGRSTHQPRESTGGDE
jgi:hypothetical protein